MNQVPSVSRAVHYYPPRVLLDDGKLDFEKCQPYPAEMTHVWSATCVNLSIRNDGSFPLQKANQARVLSRTSVIEGTMADALKEGPEFWCWPLRGGSVADAATPPPEGSTIRKTIKPTAVR